MDPATTPQTAPTNGAAPIPAGAALATTTNNPEDPSRAISAFASERNFEAALRMARALAASTLVPTAYQGNIPNVMIAMEMAARIGASVFMVMQSLDIVHGRPAWRAQFLIATVNASGRFTPIRFRWEGTPGTDEWGCRAVAKDRESGEPCVGSLITIGIAKAEGWYARNGSKWKTIPEHMLMLRAAAFWTRVYAPEMSMGMHTSEEMSDVLGGGATSEIETPRVLVPGSSRELEAELLGSGRTASDVPTAPPSNPERTAEPATAQPVVSPEQPALPIQSPPSAPKRRPREPGED